MKYLLTTLLIGWAWNLYAQRPPLDTAALTSWPHLENATISNDARYVYYSIRVEGRTPILYVQSTSDQFKMEIPGGYSETAAFTNDGKWLVCQNIDGSLFVLDLIARTISVIPHVTSYQLSKTAGDWLCYRLTNDDLMVTNLLSGSSENYGSAQDYLLSPKGKSLALQRKTNAGNIVVEWLNLAKGDKKVICQASTIENIIFSPQEDKLAFIAASGRNDTAKYKLCIYEEVTGKEQTVTNQDTSLLETRYSTTQGDLEFSPDGEKVFFYEKRISHAYPPLKIGASVDVWNYKNPMPFDGGGDELDRLRSAYDICMKKVIRLQENTDFSWSKISQGNSGNYMLTATRSNLSESFFQDSNRSTLYLINTTDGSRRAIGQHLSNPSSAEFSPDGYYVLWFDDFKHSYVAYDIASKICRKISSRLPFIVVDDRNGDAGFPHEFGTAKWLTGDSALLIYDHYDIWKVDPRGIKLPINMTGGFGRANKIVLRCSYDRNHSHQALTNSHGDLILCALDEKNKNNGFFKLDIKRSGKPIKLIMDSSLYYFSGGSSFALFPNPILKGENADRYLLVKMGIKSYPNLVVTNDFKIFKPLTDLQPEKNYNWLNAKLIRWKTFSGNIGEGILYTPENFDPKKKYPVILNYYEREADGLNNYLQADFCHGNMNIPWFVSRGYIVFQPDISYKPGNPGAGIYDYVVSAANMLAKKAWVNPQKIGIQGHSFGGFETDYLVAHTNMFAAAASSAGLSDMISESGLSGFATCSGEYFVEFGQFRMGVPFWKNIKAYMQNSAVFQVKRIMTPLLLLNNAEDGAIPWSQGVELFTALRRIGKPVWMLQYDGAGHNLIEDKNERDYTIRLTQFFDHYLKDAPEPKWMSVGVPSQMKGLEDGLSY